MIRVKIVTGKYWGREYRRDLPLSFAEVPQSRLCSLIRVLLQSDENRIFAAEVLLDLPRAILALIPAEDWGWILYNMEWCKLEPSAIRPRPYFVHNGLQYWFPADNFQNGTCLEFALADDFYNEYAESGDRSDLLKLVATLCREKKQSLSERLETGDNRIALQSRAEVEARAHRLDTLPEELAALVLFYFVGVKKLIAEIYGEWLFDSEDETEKPTKATAKSGPMFGWWSVFFDMAENITNLQTVYNTSFHTLCMMLVEKRKRAEEQEMRAKLARPDFAQ